MKTRSFLDQLMSTAQNTLGGGPDAGQGGKGPLSGDFGKGALVGGALGLLLGNRKARRFGGKMAMYGGLAALGAMAYRAYGDWKQQAGAQAAPLSATPPGVLPAPDAESDSQAILTALIAAAKADGHVDAREREVIEGEFSRMGADAAVRDWLRAELEKPLDPAEVARAATSPELASQMYLASLLAADEQSFMERTYLDELARQLNIDDALKQRLEQSLREADGAA